MAVPSLPPFDRAALLLDLDGTLLDIAPTPDRVVVPPGLPEALLDLRVALGGALAIITGRPIEAVDGLLPGIPFAVAGEHGGAIRHTPTGTIERPALPHPPEAWLAEADRLASIHPGALLERKARGFALHYRGAPEAGPVMRDALAAMLADRDDFELLPAHMLWEVRPRGVDKGVAVGALMERPPFVARLPVFLGDDVTDEDAIRAARALGGAGLRVPEIFGDAAGVRVWLHAAASTGHWPA